MKNIEKDLEGKTKEKKVNWEAPEISKNLSKWETTLLKSEAIDRKVTLLYHFLIWKLEGADFFHQFMKALKIEAISQGYKKATNIKQQQRALTQQQRKRLLGQNGAQMGQKMTEMKQFNEKFNSTTVFIPTLASDMRGSNNVEICGIESFEAPQYSTQDEAVESLSNLTIPDDDRDDTWNKVGECIGTVGIGGGCPCIVATAINQIDSNTFDTGFASILNAIAI